MIMAINIYPSWKEVIFVKDEYFQRVRSALKSKQNAGNIFQTINIWGVPTVRYKAGITQWKKKELQEMNRKTRKLITKYGGLHSRSCVDSVEDCVEEER